MKEYQAKTANVLSFPVQAKAGKPARKAGLNRNRDGSVRKVNGNVYVDFRYLEERVRENSGLPWTNQNAREVRKQLDRILSAVDRGEFRFAEVFPNSKKKNFFSQLERENRSETPLPCDIRCGEYFEEWKEYARVSGNITGRTLLTYSGEIKNYLSPYFGDKTFAEINTAQLKKFITWAKKRRLRKKEISNNTVNKHLALLKAICKAAAVDYGWKGSYDPFFGWKKLREDDPYEKINPFTLEEQKKVIEAMPEHWRPYFKFAFVTGVRVGEQIALKPGDIDWKKGIVRIKRAITLNDKGKVIEGPTKNKYSRRTLIGLPGMMEALEEQLRIHKQVKAGYFFVNNHGRRVDYSNLLGQVWRPGVEKAGLKVREMKQTRHTFATVALACGENPLWIAKRMGHRNAEMIIHVYGKYVEDTLGSNDGSALAKAYEKIFGKEE